MVRPHRSAVHLASIGAAILLAPITAAGNPNDANVVAGKATIESRGNKLNVFQGTDKAIINWQSFDIAPNEHTQFHQPSASSIALNRVTGSQSPSKIFGQLSANGRILIINPDGVLFGRNSRVDVAGLVVTTNDIRNEDFLAGRYLFDVPGNPSASIVNLGTITVADQGIAALVAPAVRNARVITARLGKVSLASGNAFTLDLYGDNLVSLAVNDEITKGVIDAATGKPVSDLVVNQGRIKADGGTVALSAATARAAVDNVINNAGIIEARSVARTKGKIILGAQTAQSKLATAPLQRVKVSGTLDVSGKRSGERGGDIKVRGEDITLVGTILDAAGHSGGGKVLVGGDYGGGQPVLDHLSVEDVVIPTSTSVRADRDVVIDVSAIKTGHGGKAVAWADRDMTFAGTILGRGGALGGDGSNVEVSGKKQLDYTGTIADLAAPRGKSGLILFDPDIDDDEEINSSVIDQGRADTISGLLNLGTSVMVWTGDQQFVNNDFQIVVAANILKTAGGDAILQFVTGGSVRVMPGIVIGSSHGKLDVVFDFDGGIDETMNPPNFRPPDALSRIILEKAARIYTNGGSVYALPTPENTVTISGYYATAEAADAAIDAVAAQFAGVVENGAYRVVWERYGDYNPSATLPYYIAARYMVPSKITGGAISTGPLPGISVVSLDSQESIAFSQLLSMGSELKLTPEQIWQFRQRHEVLAVPTSTTLTALRNGFSEANAYVSEVNPGTARILDYLASQGSKLPKWLGIAADAAQFVKALSGDIKAYVRIAMLSHAKPAQAISEVGFRAGINLALAPFYTALAVTGGVADFLGTVTGSDSVNRVASAIYDLYNSYDKAAGEMATDFGDLVDAGIKE